MQKIITNPKGNIVKITQKNENEAFEQSAKALFHILTKDALIQPIKSAKIKVSAEKLDLLLERYLTEVIKLSNEKKMNYSQFRVKINNTKNENAGELFSLEGVIFGEKTKEKKVFLEKIKEVKATVDPKTKKICVEFFIEN